MAKLPFLRDLQFAQELNFPTLDITIDRERAGQFGLTMADVARSIVPATSSSRFIQPNYWRDPVSGNAFQIQVQLPQNRMQGVERVGRRSRDAERPRRNRALTDVAAIKLGHHARPHRTLQRPARGQPHCQHPRHHPGRSGAETERRASPRAGAPPKGVSVKFRGQIPPLEQTISGLRIGLLLAVLVIFLLLAANFQSVRLALAIVLTIPAVLCGVLLMLRLTGTTLNVQSFMGAIMAIGIAVANSILLVTFAEHARREGTPSSKPRAKAPAAVCAPILMTAAAMIFGMMPMAIGFGEGGGQSAPLARAVIGGLIVSTFATLSILPSIYAILQRRASIASPSLNPMDPTSRYYDAT